MMMMTVVCVRVRRRRRRRRRCRPAAIAAISTRRCHVGTVCPHMMCVSSRRLRFVVVADKIRFGETGVLVAAAASVTGAGGVRLPLRRGVGG